jgi:pimeloyl-ACP methyl ester carboxylesterase
MAVRYRAIAAIAVLSIALTLTVSQAANADAKPKPVAARSGMISFQLPVADGRPFSPNAHNLAAPGKPGSPLLLFLPATRAVPRDYRDFLTMASHTGFHVLALDYSNRGKSVVKTCAGIPDCYAAVQQNRFDGTDPNGWSAIQPQDSILSRLRSALAHLRETDPSGGWARYGTGEHVDWKNIVVAGHSQGGGQSAFIAHRHRVHGAIMFSSPVQTDAGIPATWLTTKSATPASRMYGFVNSHDMYYQNVIGSWRALGMGAPVNANDDLLDYRKAHTVVSTTDYGTPDESHLWTATDLTPKLANGTPVYAKVWQWMLDRVR